MRRRVKDGLREARLKVRASRADVASDLAYRLVPARIDVDVGTDCETRARNERPMRRRPMRRRPCVSSRTTVSDHTASTVSYAEEQRLLVTWKRFGDGARGRIGVSVRGLAR